MSSDGELLEKVANNRELFQSVLYEDRFDDWSLARDLGEFLVRTEADSEIMGHAILTRANRHLGNRERATEELEKCRIRVKTRELHRWEIELFLPMLETEERLLSSEEATWKPGTGET